MDHINGHADTCEGLKYEGNACTCAPRWTRTPREMMEIWTPGIMGDGSELAAVLAVEATSMLIENGKIPAGPNTDTFINWRDTVFGPLTGDLREGRK